MKLQWTNELPSSTGIYLMKVGTKARPIEIIDYGSVNLGVRVHFGIIPLHLLMIGIDAWAGPIPEPSSPE